jgi:ribonucleoside-diphosphate reductase beta chain
MSLRESFHSTSRKALDPTHPAMRLFQKAKKLGIWDPRDVDFSQDRRDWIKLTETEKDILMRLATLFQAGEEAVTLDLLPLIQVIASEGRLEEEMYLTSFLWEEAKHVEAFHRFFTEVVREGCDHEQYLTAGYRRFFCEELPESLGRLRTDPSPKAQAIASATYNLVTEGVLAETGYHGYYEVLRKQGILPGMLGVVGLLQRDESRHLAYGVFLLSRLTAEHGDEIYETIQTRLGELLPIATQAIMEAFSPYDEIPFGLTVEAFVDFALAQFQRRVDRIEKARTQSIEEILGQDAEELVSA